MVKGLLANLFISAVIAATGAFVIQPVTPGSSASLHPLSAQTAAPVSGDLCPFTAAEIKSLHTVYSSDIHSMIIEINNEPIGYDDGISALEECSPGS